MSFVDTRPAPIGQGEAAANWSRFRIRNPRKQLALLHDICRGDTPLVVGSPGGATVQMALWSVDNVNNRLHFKLDAGVDSLNGMSFEDQLWAAVYVDGDKLQFALTGLKAGVDQGFQILSADVPVHIYCLPRRHSVRVRRNDIEGPRVRFTHPQQAKQPIALRLLDVSKTGCALLCPADGPVLNLGLLITQVEVELDTDTYICCDMVVHHVTQHSRSERSTRIGCEWQGVPPAALERLEAWIEQGRRRRDLMHLNVL